jgi:hypothetical protein
MLAWARLLLGGIHSTRLSFQYLATSGLRPLVIANQIPRRTFASLRSRMHFPCRRSVMPDGDGLSFLRLPQ